MAKTGKSYVNTNYYKDLKNLIQHAIYFLIIISILISSTKTIPDQELLESATSAMRATTQKLFEAKCCDPFNAICETDVRRMIEFGSINPEANVRINMVQIIGNLGAMSTLPKVGQNLESEVWSQF